MNRFLAIFGLMKIKRAETLTMRMYQYYVGCVLNSIKEDFGVPPVLDYRNASAAWWRKHFRKTLELNTNDIKIEDDPHFKK